MEHTSLSMLGSQRRGEPLNVDTLSFSHHTHRWNLKTVTSPFNCGVRTFYRGCMPIEHQDTQEKVDLCVNSFHVFPRSLSVLII